MSKHDDLIEVIQDDREAAASVAVLAEMRELILAGKADHHAEPFARHRLTERERIVAMMLERERESLNGHVIAGVRIAIEAGEHLKEPHA